MNPEMMKPGMTIEIQVFKDDSDSKFIHRRLYWSAKDKAFYVNYQNQEYYVYTNWIAFNEYQQYIRV